MLLRYFYGALGGLVLGVALMYFYGPKPVVKTETETVTQYKVKTVERIVYKPDGTQQIDRVIEDNTRAIAKTAIIQQPKNWQLELSAKSLVTKLNPVYEAELQRRIIGPLFAGVYANTDKEAGVSLGLEF